MYRTARKSVSWAAALAAVLPLLLAASTAKALPGPGESIPGVAVTSGVPVELVAKEGHTQTADMGHQAIWGYGTGLACSNDRFGGACTDDSDCSAGGTCVAPVQYPGPTLIVNQGDTVIINLTNQLPVPTSIVFPGQSGVSATGDSTGILTEEADPSGGSASYTFVASHAGTYMYHSGTNPRLQIEMGLLGAIIVRPTGFTLADPKAYAHDDTKYDREYMFLLTEMDPVIHDVVEFEGFAELDNMDYFSASFPVYWFINGRGGPDTLLGAEDPLLPVQPYNALVQMQPGEKVLMRVIDGGIEQHPFHHHGNHCKIIARDGRVLESTAGAGADLATEVFTVHAVPGSTTDCIFTWTGEQLGWDIYGTGAEFAHVCMDSSCTDVNLDGFDDTSGNACFDDVTKEYCPDHGKAIPVVLPDVNEVALGGHYSGSPYMGAMGFLPPDFTSFNPNAGYVYMWHSHTEKELVNFDIFPGGMLTMAIVEPPGTLP